MRATVITPTGERHEGVTGDLLAYYLGEAEHVPGYQVIEDEVAESVSLPRMFDGDAYVDLATPAPAAPEVEQLPDGQVFQTDGTVHESDGSSPLPDATGEVVDTETGDPADDADHPRPSPTPAI